MTGVTGMVHVTTSRVVHVVVSRVVMVHGGVVHVVVTRVVHGRVVHVVVIHFQSASFWKKNTDWNVVFFLSKFVLWVLECTANSCIIEQLDDKPKYEPENLEKLYSL